jgi:hypothetical protein
MINSDLLFECMKCEASPDALHEIIEAIVVIRHGREPPSNFLYRDPPLPFSCCKRQPRDAIAKLERTKA